MASNTIGRNRPSPVGSVRSFNEETVLIYYQHYNYVPSERKRGLDALSDSERPYYRPNNNSFVKAEEQGLVPCSEFMDLKIFYCKIRGMGACPPFRVHGFGIDEFVKFKNRPFSGRFEVKF